jgi:hypothetical protein
VRQSGIGHDDESLCGPWASPFLRVQHPLRQLCPISRDVRSPFACYLLVPSYLPLVFTSSFLVHVISRSIHPTINCPPASCLSEKPAAKKERKNISKAPHSCHMPYVSPCLSSPRCQLHTIFHMLLEPLLYPRFHLIPALCPTPGSPFGSLSLFLASSTLGVPGRNHSFVTSRCGVLFILGILFLCCDCTDTSILQLSHSCIHFVVRCNFFSRSRWQSFFLVACTLLDSIHHRNPRWGYIFISLDTIFHLHALLADSLLHFPRILDATPRRLPILLFPGRDLHSRLFACISCQMSISHQPYIPHRVLFCLYTQFGFQQHCNISFPRCYLFFSFLLFVNVSLPRTKKNILHPCSLSWFASTST